MKRAIHLEHRASSSWSKHEGESSLGLCDRLDRTRDNSQRQLPTDHDYAVPTREYQTDQSSLKPAQAAARSVLGKRQKQRQLQKQPHRSRGVDTVTPYQAISLIEGSLHWIFGITPRKRRCGREGTVCLSTFNVAMDAPGDRSNSNVEGAHPASHKLYAGNVVRRPSSIGPPTVKW